MSSIISSKEFDSMVTLDNLQRLEQYSKKCTEFFQQTNFKVKLEDIPLNFPAYVENNVDPPILHIKQPTYKVKVILLEYNASEKVDKLLGQINGLSPVYLTHCFIKNQLGNMREMFLPEVMCLKSTLQDNVSLKDNVCDILSSNHITFEVWPAYSISGQPVSINQNFVEPYTEKKGGVI